ncbi:hypothetical protein [Candidatus Tisiphia endosymbiont of Beris chalybata]|uniref:hypothetical protein n=1 Tax=Candidatus Tisiphia endosymbiont of Beris chalybata TaxID=3066262 RepID=UPI00312CB82B
MKEVLAKSLRGSLEEERRAAKKKNYYNFTNDKFAKADQIFESDSKFPNQDTSTNNANKVIRDTFTISVKDYELINLCKNKLLTKHYSANKSEIVRAGLIVLSQMSDEDMLLSIQKVEKIKTGRPKNTI